MPALSSWRAVALAALAWLALPVAHAAPAPEFLDPDQAFSFTAAVIDGGRTVEARFHAAEGYYLYRDRFAFTASAPVQLGAPQFPQGHVKFDKTFGRELTTYRGDVAVRLPIVAGSGSFILTAKLQGCADAGLCYAPDKRTLELQAASLPASGAPSSGDRVDGGPAETGRIEAALHSGSLLAIVPLFLVFGLLLSCTPCVLPMVPILSSIIVGQATGAGGSLTRARSFLLALSYALGVASVYTGLGVAAGLAGAGLAAALQQPWVLSLFAALLVGLALSMFGLYELQLPSSWQTRVAQISGRAAGGRLAGVFLMGALSALIIGPCVAPPLAGTLLYISQTRDVFLGAAALFALAMGMSLPLLLVGLSAGSLLPRAGRWMESVKRVFGVLLLGVAIWELSSVIPVWAQMLAWAILFLVGASFLRVLDALPAEASGWQRLWKGVGLVLLVLGTAQVVGAASGAQDVLRPLERLAAGSGGAAAPGAALAWRTVQGTDGLDAALAGAEGKPVLLDFYADWCTACKEMDRLTFADPLVEQRLAGFRLLRADVTADTASNQALLRRFQLFGPPATVFLDPLSGKESAPRVIGYEPAERFLASVARIDPAKASLASAN